MSDKSPDAFRTISEVSEWLDTPTYVLRFWESKFPQIKPVKRAGGRRYYRPEDMQLLGGIKKLLHFDDHTIKAVKDILKDKGVKHVMALSPDLDTPVKSPEPADKDQTHAEIDDLIAQTQSQPKVDVRVVKKALSAEEDPPQESGDQPTPQSQKDAAATKLPQSDPKPESGTDPKSDTKADVQPETRENKEPAVAAEAAEAAQEAQSDDGKASWELLDPRIVEPVPYRIATRRAYTATQLSEIESIYEELTALRDRLQSSEAQAG